MIDLPIILEAKKGVEHAAKSVFVIWASCALGNANKRRQLNTLKMGTTPVLLTTMMTMILLYCWFLILSLL